MKKVVRTVWISLLTGLAFLVACTCQNKLTRAERKQLRQERDSIVAQASRTGDPNSNLSKDRKYQLRKKQRDYELWQRVYEIDTLLGDKKADNRHVMNAALPAVEYCRAICCMELAINSTTPIIKPIKKPR